MGNVSIDLSLSNIWKSWRLFRRGKRASADIDEFAYYLEGNLLNLYLDLNKSVYRHGRYHKFIVTDNKRREISVALVRDRVLHRLLYQYLVEIYDKTFIYDLWSCRAGKGVLDAVVRTQKLLHIYHSSFVWRADITKFFDNVSQDKLFEILSFRVTDPKAKVLLKEVLYSYPTPGISRGIPIGNLTSQIFANIYLNELDRFVSHNLRPQAYLRYGDDFIIITESLQKTQDFRTAVIQFLAQELEMKLNPKNDIIVASKKGLKFLGTEIFPTGRRLKKRNWQRASSRLTSQNLGSYYGLITKHANKKKVKQLLWTTINIYE